jgi:hypothetical protein
MPSDRAWVADVYRLAERGDTEEVVARWSGARHAGGAEGIGLTTPGRIGGPGQD